MRGRSERELLPLVHTPGLTFRVGGYSRSSCPLMAPSGYGLLWTLT
jgi:hypothetical protein